MFEQIKENDIWHTLKAETKPIVLYGMGNGADKIIEICAEKRIAISDIFASDDFVRGHCFHGMRVKKLSEIETLYEDFTVLLSFASNRHEVIDNIFSIARRHTVLAPDVPVSGTGLFTKEFVRLHEKEFDKAYHLLADEQSKQNYINILNFKISGKLDYLIPFTPKETAYSEYLKPSGETIVDLGAYDGDTVKEFALADPAYQKIFAFEPDNKNFKKLCRNTKDMRDVTVFNTGAWNKTESLCFDKKNGRNSSVSPGGTKVAMDTVDHTLKEPVSLIKMDIEGSELKAIEGATQTIKKYRPKLYICAYHRNEDMFAIPLKIHEICNDYRFYFCHHQYIPAWESNFYGIIKGE